MKRNAQLREDWKGVVPSPADTLIADEEERKRRDKKRAKYCPVCGRRPEIPFINAGRHIYTGHCEKCETRFTVHVIE